MLPPDVRRRVRVVRAKAEHMLRQLAQLAPTPQPPGREVWWLSAYELLVLREWKGHQPGRGLRVGSVVEGCAEVSEEEVGEMYIPGAGKVEGGGGCASEGRAVVCE